MGTMRVEECASTVRITRLELTVNNVKQDTIDQQIRLRQIVMLVKLVHATEGFPLVNVLMVMGGASVLITTVDLIVLSVMRDFMDSPIANLVTAIHWVQVDVCVAQQVISVHVNQTTQELNVISVLKAIMASQTAADATVMG